MPPIKHEKQLIGQYIQKQKDKMSMHQLDKYLENRLFIDVNDPWFNYVMQDMKDKNENF